MDDSVLTPHVLGAHPGLSILRLWQGVVEIALRITLALCSLCSLALPAAVISEVARGSPSATDLEKGSKGAGLFVICFASLAGIVEVLIVVLRFLNIGIINLQMKKFFIVDITISVVLVVGYIIAGLTQAVYAGKWSTASASCKTASGALCKDQDWWKIEAAATVSCLTCAVLAGVLGVWSLLFIVKRWYYRMLQYMSLP